MLLSISKTEMDSHERAKLAARAHGLVHVGFGNYAKKEGGKVTHRIQKDAKGEYKLYKVVQQQTKKKTGGAPVKKDKTSDKQGTPILAVLQRKAEVKRDPKLDTGGTTSYAEAVKTFGGMASPLVHNDWSEKAYAGWYKSLNADEREILCDYKDESFQAINDGLRVFKGKLSSDNPRAKDVEILDRAIKRAKLPNDQVVFRGMNMRGDMQSPNFDYSHLEGKELQDDAYTSVTTRPSVTEDFLHTGPDSVFMHMILPKGCSAASMNKGVDSTMRNTAESELLLPRGMKFMVKKVEKVKKNERPPAHIMHVVPIFPDD
jgi:hypothetical protein